MRGTNAMNMIKIIVMFLILTLVCGIGTFSYAQNNKDSEDEYKEFDFIAFDKLLEDGKIDEAEAIYNDWIIKRQEMLNGGSKFGFIDMLIKYKYALIKFNKKEYNDVIYILDEILDYMKNNINDDNDKNLIGLSMILKATMYYNIGDNDNSLAVNKENLEFSRQYFGEDDIRTLLAKYYTAMVYTNLKEHQKAIDLDEEILPKMKLKLGEDSSSVKEIVNRLDYNYGEIIIEKLEQEAIKLNEAGRYNEAASKYEELINLMKESYGQDFFPADSIRKLAKINLGRGKAAEAIEQLDQIIKYLEDNDSENYVSILTVMLDKAQAYYNMGDFQSSFKLDHEISERSKNILGEEHNITLKAMIQLGIDYGALGNNKKSVDILKSLMTKSIKVFGNKSQERWDILYFLARGYCNLSQYKNGQKMVLERINLSNEWFGENHPRTLAALNDLCDIYFALGEDDKGLELINKITDIANRELEENDWHKLEILNNRAEAYERIGRYREAINLYIQVAEKQEQTLGTFHRERINTILDISRCSKIINDYTNSLKFDLSVFQNIDNISLNSDLKYKIKATIMRNLSETYLKLGRYDDALKLAQDSLEISQKYVDDQNTISSIVILTDVYRMMGNFSEAIELDKQAYDISKKLYGINSEENLYYMLPIAFDYFALKDFKTTIKLSKEILKEYKQSNYDDFLRILKTKGILASSYLNTKKYEEAIQLYEEVLNIKLEVLGENNSETLDTKYDLAFAYIISDLEKNIYDSDKIKKARSLFSDVINGYENIRSNQFNSLSSDDKNQWFATHISKYKNISNVFYMFKFDDFSLQVSELCKARNLVDKYSAKLFDYSSILKDEEINKLNDYEAQISRYDERIKEAINNDVDEARINLENNRNHIISNYNSYKKQLRIKYPQYKNLSDKGKSSLHFEQSRQLLPEDACFIEFLSCDNSLLIFVLNKTGNINAVKISTKDGLLKKCNLYRELLAYPNIESMRADNKYLWKLSNGSYKFTDTRKSPAANAIIVNSSKDFNSLRQELSKELGEKLLEPLENYISQKSTWIISPDDELNNIPFETLQFNGKVAIESANISYVPSLAVLKLMKEQETKNLAIENRKGLFAMGDAVYGNSNNSESRGTKIGFLQNLKRSSNYDVDLTTIKWNNLPGTGKELDQVSTVFNDKEIIRGRNASETNLKTLDKNGNLSEYKYLLFATHGLFVPERPELSSIVLSQGLNKNNDGYVTVGEWMGYNLNSDLVYLSACESGLGEYQAGEGIVGIPYALTIAGNKDTVMSLWKVNDEATAEFSASFFKKLSEGQSEVKALNDTKREFLANPNAKFNSPSVWAAFLLYGI